MSLIKKIKTLALSAHPEVVAIRRHLHAHPELSFEEYQTSAFVQEKLTQYGLPFTNGIANTGVVAYVEGKKPGKKTIALRADMDALPITEANEVPYKSTVPGVMHACGHDAHTASLLGAAKILSQLKNEFEGTVKLIFQPAEERSPGGASIMIKEGVLETPKPAGIIGQHVYSMLPAGAVGFRSGMMMASCDEIDLYIYGKGGHGAVPQLTIDPIVLAAHIVTALQQVVSRLNDPTVPCVLTLGKIESVGGAYNIIPEEVRIQGTLRTMNEQWRKEAKQKIEQIATGVATAMGGVCRVQITDGYPFLINDEELTARCKQAAIELLGKENVHDLPMRMTAEDFAYYTQQIKGCFYRLGTGNAARGITANVHTPIFDIDEEALITGMGLMAWLALNELQD
ncbi:amidohydrolase [Sphingobacteriales bacterium UPWRP_1]|nr:N-acyl-L-amino acid amidohydrolase [Sphingobacteriales bacterium TSM_CSS]PSJ78339.1 amidohydrolase [Sphingobacteriales bacterium UPWRP_1]